METADGDKRREILKGYADMEETGMPERGIHDLVRALQSSNGAERGKAREAIVRLGSQAVPILIRLMSEPRWIVRWEACKSLGNLRNPAAGEALAEALGDENVEVRWLAAEALIALGRRAIVPVLHVLQSRFSSLFVRQGAHHVLHALEREGLLNPETIAVLETLRYLEPQIAVPVAARKALDSMLTSMSHEP